MLYVDIQNQVNSIKSTHTNTSKFRPSDVASVSEVATVSTIYVLLNAFVVLTKTTASEL